MDTLSFVLGIALVVVIAIAIVAVYAFVKVNKHSKSIERIYVDMNSNIDISYRYANSVEENLSRKIDNVERTFNSELDSRLDKLESRLKTKK